MSTKRLVLVVMALVAFAAMVGCVKSAEPRDIPVGASPDATATPEALNFSNTHFTERNEAGHRSRLEWWYHSGHLISDSGREFGFHFVVFKADTDGTNSDESLNFVSQLGILDVETGKHYEVSRAQAGARSIGDAPMTIAVADWVYGVMPTGRSQFFMAEEDAISLELNAAATTPVMLHNEIGWLPTEAGSTYYYSWPRQDLSGELTIEGEKISVTGTGWFDHQWGDFVVLGKPAGWQWFAIQLNDGGSLMITESRSIDGETVITYGTYMSPDGAVRHLEEDSDGIDLNVNGRWTSAETDATYPSGWDLRVDSLGLDLELVPAANDQEVQGGLPSASTYWEGKVLIGGLQNGSPISGNAFAELSGYVDPDPVEWMQR